jgi:O-antigen/teichoic acid export membrane protein
VGAIATKPVSRKIATLLGVGFQYASLALMIVRGVVLVPIMAKFIDHEVLGAWYASGNILNWLMLSEGGIWLLLRQQTAKALGGKDLHDLGETIGAGSILMLSIGALIAMSSLLLAPHVPRLFHIAGAGASQLAWSFALAGIGMALSLPAVIPRAVQHGLQRPLGVNAVLLSAEAISLLATILLMFRGFGVLALGLGILTREVVHNLGNWPILVNSLKTMRIAPRVSVHRCRSFLGLLGWTSLSQIAIVFRQNFDAIIISQLLGNSVVLVNEWTKRLWDLLSSFTLRASGAFTPAMAHLHGEGDLKKFRRISGELLHATVIGTGLTLAIGLAFNHSFVRLWVGPSFYAGATYNVLFGVANVVTLLTFTIVEVLYAANCIRAPAIIQIIQTAVRLLLLVFLVHWLGLLGVPLSTLGAALIGGSTRLIAEWRKTLQVSRQRALGLMAPLARALSIAVIAALVWRLLPDPASWSSLAIQAAAFGAVLVTSLFVFDSFSKRMIVGVVSMGKLRVRRYACRAARAPK